MIHKSLWHSLTLWLEAQRLLAELLAWQLLSATTIKITPIISNRFLSRFFTIKDKFRVAGGCQIVAAWKRKLVRSRKRAIWSSYKALGHHGDGQVSPLISLITSQLFPPLSGSFNLSVHFYRLLVEIPLFLVVRHQLCIPASWCMHDLAIFCVASQQMLLNSVSYLPENISQFLALDLYHFIASKAPCEH